MFVQYGANLTVSEVEFDGSIWKISGTPRPNYDLYHGECFDYVLIKED